MQAPAFDHEIDERCHLIKPAIAAQRWELPFNNPEYNRDVILSVEWEIAGHNL